MKTGKRIISIVLVAVLVTAIPNVALASGNHHGQMTGCGHSEHAQAGQGCFCDEDVWTSAPLSAAAEGTSASDEAAENLRALLEELPSVEELKTLPMQTQKQWYLRTQEVYAAYMELTDEMKAGIFGAEAIFDALFGYFNSLTAPLGAADNVRNPGTVFHESVWNIIHHTHGC